MSNSFKDKRNLDLVDDDRWKKKGGPIKQRVSEPEVCPNCHGMGTIDNIHPCPVCEGEGEVWE